MMKANEKLTVEIKNGNKWELYNEYTDTSYIYERLAKDLLHKKIHKAASISSIKDRCNYDGTRTITVTYSNNVRSIYIIND